MKLLICRPDCLNNHYICGKSPREDEEPGTENLDVDHEYFEKEIWETLAHRVPAFEEVKVNNPIFNITIINFHYHIYTQFFILTICCLVNWDSD